MKNLLCDADVEYIKNLLRRGTTKWKGRADCLRRARKRFKEGYLKNGKPNWKYYWKCAHCEQWFRDEDSMEVDHITEIGSFKGDWNDFINKVYDWSRKNLQALCIVCHKKKTKKFNAATTRWQRKKKLCVPK